GKGAAGRRALRGPGSRSRCGAAWTAKSTAGPFPDRTRRPCGRSFVRNARKLRSRPYGAGPLASVTCGLMRHVSRRSLLGFPVQDCHGEEVGRVVDTWPNDGGWEVQLIVVRLPRFGERRMLPADEVH